jgi:hemolysin D
MKSVKKIVPFPQTAARRRDYELAFLPAALEITETPPSPTRRVIAATIIALFCLAVAWASLGTTDIVATAPGKIVPSGRTKVIQPFETGVVRAINVHDGQNVKTGDVLIALDPTMTRAELGHLKSDLMNAQLDIARLRSALAGNDDPLADFHPPQGASPTLIEMQRQFLISQTTEQNAKLAEIDRQSAQKEAERATIKATIEKLNATIPLLQQRVDVRKYLADKELGSKLNYLTDLQDLVGQQQDLLVQQSRYREADAAVGALAETRAKVQSQYRRTLFDDLAKAEQKAGGLVEDVKKAEERTKLQELIAPVDGVVQQLDVHTVGGVVTPAQVLAVVVPVDSHLEIEAMVSNHDIGFVHTGQEAEIKVDTFSFTRYGLLHGKVLNVSQDAITRQKPEDKTNGKSFGAEPTSSEPKGQEMIYAARVSLDQTQMQIEDKMVNLSPGMAVTVEIKTGSRRIISYLLSPVLRYRQETLRER